MHAQLVVKKISVVELSSDQRCFKGLLILILYRVASPSTDGQVLSGWSMKVGDGAALLPRASVSLNNRSVFAARRAQEIIEGSST
jgi:hypothetical protein